RTLPDVKVSQLHEISSALAGRDLDCRERHAPHVRDLTYQEATQDFEDTIGLAAFQSILHPDLAASAHSPWPRLAWCSSSSPRILSRVVALHAQRQGSLQIGWQLPVFPRGYFGRAQEARRRE